MSGNITGGKKSAMKNLANDPDFYKKIGSRGGSRTGVIKGFALNQEAARIAGKKGGSISRRKKVV